jgi:hypothetical protein
MKGNITAIKLIIERAEGLPKQVTESMGTLAITVKHV